MVKSVHLLGSFAIALGLTVPALAEGQAIPRTSGGSSSSSGSSGSSGSSSSGGGGTVSSSGSRGGGERTSPPPSSPSSSPSAFGSSEPSRGRTPSKTSTSSGKGSDAARPAPGGVVSTGSSDSLGSAARRASGIGATDPAVFLGSGSRVRGANPVAGTAVPRAEGLGELVSFPLFGPWGRWYPWFGSGFGWNSFLGYDPWLYGATWWNFGAYGFWYDPFSYYWDPYWSSSMYSTGAPAKAKVTTGNIRVRANVPSAKVYIDGALVGLASEFSGLVDHLEVDYGKRTIELRAEGYTSVTKNITVAAGKTQTVRVSLKKTK